MALDRKALEQIERIVYKNSDDIAVSIARSFERIEETIADIESHVLKRLTDIETKLYLRADELDD